MIKIRRVSSKTRMRKKEFLKRRESEEIMINNKDMNKRAMQEPRRTTEAETMIAPYPKDND